MTVLAVAVGGGIGAWCRYALGGVIVARQQRPFPVETLVINVLGSLLLGALAGSASAGRLPDQALTWGGTGFCGAFTTFSTFTFETLRLIEDGAWRTALTNLLLSGSLCFAGAGITFHLFR
ncbi:MAG: fluoride efflux transporter CrcB [Actinobacteria bacterium]|nr:fluoride efflux transporter CrcB [Actinomycetota bacterium]